MHKWCSRLAVLGELGRYPVFVPAIKLCLKYQYHLDKAGHDSLIGRALLDMKSYPQLDCWYSRVENIKSLLDFPRLYGKVDKAGKTIDRLFKSKFDRFYLDEINKLKIGSDGNDHNKLRLYKQLKVSFKQEPNITNIQY